MIVVEGGISADYFLDKMQPYEINTVLKGLELKSRENWEQARLIAFVTAQCNSTKKITPQDIIKFPWEKEEGRKARVSEDDIKRLNEKAKHFINQKENG